MPDGLSIVVPTHNRGRRLPALLGAIAATEPVGEIIVVDDASTDVTPNVLAKLSVSDRRLRIIRHDENRGPTAARRAGVTAATRELVLCLDDDVFPEIGAVAGHLRCHHDGDAEVVVGYMPLRPQPGTPRTVAERYARLYEERARQWSGHPESILPSLWGGFVSFRRADYLAADARCDPGLRYHEDLELGVVLHQMGRRAHFDYEIRAEHHHGRTVQSTLTDNRRGGEALATLERRHPDDVSAGHRFSRERSSTARSALMHTAANPAVRWVYGPALRLAETRLGPGRLGGRLLALGCRSHYYVGYTSAAS